MSKSNFKKRSNDGNLSILFLFSSFIYIFITFIEVFTYKGFISNHFLISNKLILIGNLILGSLLIFEKKINEWISRAITEFLIILSSSLFVAFIYFNYLNEIFYPNFTFAKFHISNNGIIQIISYCTLLIIWLNIDFRAKLYISKLKVSIIVFLLGLYLFSNLNFVLLKTGNTISPILAKPFASYDQKIERFVGPFYLYTLWVHKVTPEKSAIILPPQAGPWGESGNLGFARYFLFTQKLTNWTNSLKIDEDWDYIGVSPGNELMDGDYKLWPNFPVKAKLVYTFDPSTGIMTQKAGDYDPRDFTDTKLWGLIQLR